MNRAPIVNIVLPLIVGIILANWIILPLWSLLIIMLVLIVPLSIFTFHHSKYLYYFFHYPFWIIIGLLLVVLHNPLRKSNHYSHYIHPNSQITATVIAPPQTSSKTLKVVVAVDVIDSISTIGKMMLFVEPSAKTDSISYGDKILMVTSPQIPSGEDNPYQFNYCRYLKNRDIYYQSYLSSNNYKLIQKNPRGLIAYSISLRQNLIDKIQHLNLTESQKGIVEALFLGWDNDLTEVSRQQFRDAGLAHLLCVSGLHVGVVAGIIGLFLFFLGKSPCMRIIKGIIQLLGVWFFAMLTGLAPATTRAALMFSIFILGNMFMLQRNSYNTLAISALILLLFNPSLIYDVGFQLSYCAVLGVLSLVNPLYHLIPWKDRAILESKLDSLSFLQRQLRYIPFRLSQKLWNLVCLTTAAQISVLPITLYYFHQFPIYFLIANLTIVPFAGVLLFTIMIAVIFNQSAFLTKLLALELCGIDSLTNWISNLPNASITHIYFDVFMLICVIVILISFIIWLHRPTSKFYILSIFSLLILLIHVRVQQSIFDKQQFFVVYDLNKSSAIEFFEGHKTTLWTDSIVVENPNLEYQNDNLHTMTMSNYHNFITLDTCKYLRFGSSKLYIVDSMNQWASTSIKPTHVIITGNPSLSISNLRKRINFDTIIITNNNSYYHRTKWSHECDSLNIPYYDITNQGAFLKRED